MASGGKEGARESGCLKAGTSSAVHAMLRFLGVFFTSATSWRNEIMPVRAADFFKKAGEFFFPEGAGAEAHEHSRSRRHADDTAPPNSDGSLSRPAGPKEIRRHLKQCLRACAARRNVPGL